MIPVKWRYKRARARLDEIQEWSTPAEAYVLAVFFTEKIIRRTLVQLVIWKGRTAGDAFETVKKLKGIWAVKKTWNKYDIKGRSLEVVIGNANWGVLKDAADYRNDLVHGSGHQAQKVYRKQLPPLLAALDDIKSKLSTEYGYSGWKGMKDRAGNPI